MKKTARIKLAIDHTGRWVAAGWSKIDGTPDEEAGDYIADDLYPGERYYWIEAEVEAPTEETIQASAVHPDPAS